MKSPTREDQLTGTEAPVATQPQTAEPPVEAVEGEVASAQQQVAEAVTAATDQEHSPEDEDTALNTQGLELLKLGKVIEFNMLRKQYSDWKPHFPEISLKGLNLAGINLNEAMLPFIDFSQANLIGAQFNRACLMRAKFNGASITNCTFDGADLMGAEFRETRFVYARHNQMGLFGTNLNGAKFEGAQGLTTEMLSRASFHGAQGLNPELVDEALALIKKSTLPKP